MIPLPEKPIESDHGFKKVGPDMDHLIGSFLNPEDLKTISVVSKIGLEMGNDPKTWAKFAKNHGITIHDPNKAKAEVIHYYKTINSMLLKKFPELNTKELKSVQDEYQRNELIHTNLSKIDQPKRETRCFHMIEEAFQGTVGFQGFNEDKFNAAVMLVKFVGNWEEALSIVNRFDRPEQFQILLDEFLQSKVPEEQKMKILNNLLHNNIAFKSTSKDNLSARSEIIEKLMTAGARTIPKSIEPGLQFIVFVNCLNPAESNKNTSLESFYKFSTNETREKLMKDSQDPTWMISDITEELKKSDRYNREQVRDMATEIQANLKQQLQKASTSSS